MFLAYLDPGAGSLFIQALLAGILAVPFFFRTKLAGFLNRVRKSSPSSSSRERPDDID
jgi:hypothetical protein